MKRLLVLMVSLFAYAGVQAEGIGIALNEKGQEVAQALLVHPQVVLTVRGLNPVSNTIHMDGETFKIAETQRLRNIADNNGRSVDLNLSILEKASSSTPVNLEGADEFGDNVDEVSFIALVQDPDSLFSQKEQIAGTVYFNTFIVDSASLPDPESFNFGNAIRVTGITRQNLSTDIVFDKETVQKIKEEVKSFVDNSFTINPPPESDLLIR